MMDEQTLPATGAHPNVQTGVVQRMLDWRHHLHAHPEFGFETARTAAFIAGQLRSFGLEVVEDVGGGVLATLRRGASNKAIALRADFDALRIQERGSAPHRSRTDGLMHACGHDGHTAMLLGAASILASEGGFDGTLHFIFQPAEEWGKGALAMLDAGLIDRFPFQEIYGLHNMPGLPLGQIATRSGALMAAEDNFEVTVTGRGGHAARPHHAQDALLAACAIVVGLQTIVARELAPSETAVVSATELIADGTRNVLAGAARILGDCRSFSPQVSARIEQAMVRIATQTAQAYGCSAAVRYTREFIPLINDSAAAASAAAAASTVVGPQNVNPACAPSSASEDFAQFLQHVRGAFVFLGNGEASPPLHNPDYDFADAALPIGAAFHVELARQRLPLMPPMRSLDQAPAERAAGTAQSTPQAPL